MPAKNAKTDSGGFSTGERAAMKARAHELRAEGKKGAKKADDLQATLDSIAQMAADDRGATAGLAGHAELRGDDGPAVRPRKRRRSRLGWPVFR
jgi:hypothetical protein